MANWTVSSHSSNQQNGDTVNDGDISAYVDLTITPNTGYVIDKTMFVIGGATESPAYTFVGGNLDNEVYKVEFINNPSNDSKVGSSINKVTARVHFAEATGTGGPGGSSWAMSTADKNILPALIGCIAI